MLVRSLKLLWLPRALEVALSHAHEVGARAVKVHLGMVLLAVYGFPEVECARLDVAIDRWCVGHHSIRSCFATLLDFLVSSAASRWVVRVFTTVHVFVILGLSRLFQRLMHRLLSRAAHLIEESLRRSKAEIVFFVHFRQARARLLRRKRHLWRNRRA